MEYVDMHCHCHEISIDELREYTKKIILVCVSDDPGSSEATIELTKYVDIVPCIGIHPWEAHNYSLEDVNSLARFIDRHGIKCLGEIGLDKKFYPHTFEHQLKIFIRFLEIAREYDLFMNLHTAGAWREVYELLLKYDIKKAYFHWYTGPKTLLDSIVGSGYYIGINPAWKIQEKHRKIIEYAPITNIITESDAPYKYRNLYMKPDLVFETIGYIAKVKNMDYDEAKQVILNNYRRLFR